MRRHRRLRRGLALLLSILGPCAGGEAWLRSRESVERVRVCRETTFGQWHPILGWSGRPGFSERMTEVLPGPDGRLVPVLDYRVTMNARGDRSTREYADRAPAGTRRVVVVGDSYTFGVGVDDDQTFCARLERKTGAEVVNLGMPGYSVAQMHLRMVMDGLPRRPDVVVLALIGDSFRRATLGWSDNGTPRPRFELHGDRLVRPAFPLPRPLPVGAQVPVSGGLRLARALRRDETWPLGAAIVREAAATARAAGARFVLAYLASEGEGGSEADEGPVPFAATSPAFAEERPPTYATLALDLGVPFVDTTRGFARGGAGLFIPIDKHPSAAGHALLADLLEPAIR